MSLLIKGQDLPHEIQLTYPAIYTISDAVDLCRLRVEFCFHYSEGHWVKYMHTPQYRLKKDKTHCCSRRTAGSWNVRGGNPQRACLCLNLWPALLRSAAYSSVPACSGLTHTDTITQRKMLSKHSTLTWILSAQEKTRMHCLTCDGLEQVSTVLHVVVSVVVVGSLTKCFAFLIGSEVLLHGHLEVVSRQSEWVVAVVTLPQQELGLRESGRVSSEVVYGHNCIALLVL